MATEHFGVIEARDQLPDLVRRVRETPTVSFDIGRYRRRDATLIAASQAMPPPIQSTLLKWFWCFEADTAVLNGDAVHGEFLHAGDPVGTVVAWLWRSRREDVGEHLAIYLSELQRHAPARIRVAAHRQKLTWPDFEPVTLDDLLKALGPAMPYDFEKRDLVALRAHAQSEVPKWM